MRRVRVAVLTVALVALLVVPASSQLVDPTAPARLAVLIKIATTLGSVYRFLYQVNEATQSLRNRMNRMFPNETLDEIRSLFAQVRSIQDEISGLACDWQFSPRVTRLRGGLLKLGPLCRREYQDAFGAPLIGVDADLEEYRQWQGTLRWNVVADTIAVSKVWGDAAAALSREARQGGNPNDPDSPYSVGYSQRLLAVNESLRLQVAARENAQEAVRLAGLQEDLDRERREDWQRKNAGIHVILGVERPGSIRRPSVGRALAASLGD